MRSPESQVALAAPASDVGLRHIHATLALLVVVAVIAAQQISMVRQWPAHPGWADWAHLLAGLGAAACLAGLLASGLRKGRRAAWWPLADAAGRARLAREVRELLRGRLPASEAGGLLSLIQGLLLIAVAAAALSGCVWLVAPRGDAAMAIGDLHQLAAGAVTVLLPLHLLAVALHLRDFF